MTYQTHLASQPILCRIRLFFYSIKGPRDSGYVFGPMVSIQHTTSCFAFCVQQGRAFICSHANLQGLHCGVSTVGMVSFNRNSINVPWFITIGQVGTSTTNSGYATTRVYSLLGQTFSSIGGVIRSSEYRDCECQASEDLCSFSQFRPKDLFVSLGDHSIFIRKGSFTGRLFLSRVSRFQRRRSNIALRVSSQAICSVGDYYLVRFLRLLLRG